MSSLTKESILSRKTAPQKVPVDGYGDYYVRMLTRAEFSEAFRSGQALDTQEKTEHWAGAFILGASICDEEGRILFVADDRKQVRDLEMPVFKALKDAVDKLHKLNVSDEQVAADAKK